MAARAMVVLYGVCLLTAPCLAGADWLDQFSAACRARGGTPVHNPGAGGYCDMSRAGSTGSGSASGVNPYLPGVQNWLDGLEALTRQNAAAGKERRAAMLQALEAERQSALRRQDAARAANLAEIQRRLMNNELRLKPDGTEDAKPREYGLPGRHIFRNDIFTGQRDAPDQECGPGSQWTKPETCKAPLTLKLGDESTASLRQPQAQPAAAPAPAAIADARPPERPNDPAEVARVIAGFTPEERRQFLAALDRLPATGAAPDAGAAPAALPSAHSAPSAAANPQPRRGLGEAHAAAEALRARADDSATSLESLKERADLQDSARASPAQALPRPNRVDQGRPPSPATPGAVAAIRGPAAEGAPSSPPRLSPSAGMQTGARSTLVLPRGEDPLSFRAPEDRDLFALLQGAGTPQELAQRRELAAGIVISAATVVSPDSGASGYQPNYLQREALIAHFAPELLEPYRRDNAFAARVDAAIQESIRHGRDFRAKLDQAAWNRSGKPAWDSPQLRQERIDNARNAQVQMSAHMSASFAELRAR